MPKSKWKEVERELARGGALQCRYLWKKMPSTPYVRLHFHCTGKIPMRTYRKMWALAKNNTHPIINQTHR